MFHIPIFQTSLKVNKNYNVVRNAKCANLKYVYYSSDFIPTGKIKTGFTFYLSQENNCKQKWTEQSYNVSLTMII